MYIDNACLKSISEARSYGEITCCIYGKLLRKGKQSLFLKEEQQIDFPI